MLTDAQCRAAIGKAKPYKLADRDSLYLLVMPSGAKYWRGNYQFQGKAKTLALGVYPEVSLREARSAWAMARQHPDPAGARRSARRTAVVAADDTLECIARAWHREHVQARRLTPKHAAQVLRTLEADVFPTLGARAVASIAPGEVLALVRGVEARAPETAARVLQRIVNAFDFAVTLGKLEVNPAARLAKFLGKRDRGRHAALPAARLGAFLRALAVYRGDPETREALRFLVLTIGRTREVLGARWAEIDWEAATWTVPTGRMKARREHVVPLSRQALALLRELHPLTGRHDYIFPGRSAEHLSQDTLRLAMRRMGFAEGEGTVHGFRAVASTLLNEHGFRGEVIETALAHAERNAVRAAYNRALYLDERRAMLQWWADYLDRARAGAEIIPIDQRKIRHNM